MGFQWLENHVGLAGVSGGSFTQPQESELYQPRRKQRLQWKYLNENSPKFPAKKSFTYHSS